MILISIIQTIIICYVLSDLAEFISTLVFEIKLKKRLLNITKNLLVYMLSCPKCFSFWLGLILTGSLFWSCVVAILINIIKSLEYKYINKTPL